MFELFKLQEQGDYLLAACQRMSKKGYQNISAPKTGKPGTYNANTLSKEQVSIATPNVMVSYKYTLHTPPF